MKIFIVDYENASNLSLIKGIQKGDEIHILYTEDCKIDAKMVEFLQRKEVKIKSIHVNKHGKQALDFQLDMYLGYLIGNNKEKKNFIIVSNDDGFENVVDFAKNNLHTNVKIQRPNKVNIDTLPEEVKQMEKIRSHFKKYASSKNSRNFALAIVDKKPFEYVEKMILSKYETDFERRRKIIEIAKSYY